MAVRLLWPSTSLSQPITTYKLHQRCGRQIEKCSNSSSARPLRNRSAKRLRNRRNERQLHNRKGRQFPSRNAKPIHNQDSVRETSLHRSARRLRNHNRGRPISDHNVSAQRQTSSGRRQLRHLSSRSRSNRASSPAPQHPGQHLPAATRKPRRNRKGKKFRNRKGKQTSSNRRSAKPAPQPQREEDALNRKGTRRPRSRNAKPRRSLASASGSPGT